jgi:hypothetical protein
MIEITEKIITDLMENACGFQGLSLGARNKVRDQYKENEKSEENSLRLMIDGLIAKIAQEQTIKEEGSGLLLTLSRRSCGLLGGFLYPFGLS